MKYQKESLFEVEHSCLADPLVRSPKSPARATHLRRQVRISLPVGLVLALLTCSALAGEASITPNASTALPNDSSSVSEDSLENPTIESKQIKGYKAPSLHALTSTRFVGDFDWTPKGDQIIAVTSLAGSPNLWSIPTKGEGWPEQLTFEEQLVESPRVGPNGKWVLYTIRKTQSGPRDLTILSLEKNSSQNLTKTFSVDEKDPEWSPSGARIVFVSDEAQAGSYQPYVCTLRADGRAGPRKLVGTRGEPASKPIWSPDGRKIALERHGKERNTFLTVIDIATRTETLVAMAAKNHRWSLVDWSPDSESLLATSDESGYANVVLLNIRNKAVTRVTDRHGDTVAYDWSPRGTQVNWTTNIDGNIRIHVGLAKTLPRGTAMRVRHGKIHGARFSPDGNFLAFIYSGPTRTPDLWIYDLSRRFARQLTFSRSKLVVPDFLVEPYVVHYPAFDGLSISGFLYVPPNLVDDARRPAIVWAHDGPESQYQNGFEPAVQYLVSLGYVVFVPNYRGSWGEGLDFRTENDLDWGGGDLQDLVEAASFLRKTPYVDPDKLFLLGEGYGAYLTLMAMTRAPEHWLAGVSISGTFDLVRTYRRSTGGLHRYLELEMGRPDKQQGLWLDRSPAQYLANIRAPLLVLQDDDNPWAQERDINASIRKMKDLGLPVEYGIIPGIEPGHPPNEIAVKKYLAVADFLDRRLEQIEVAAAKARHAETAETKHGKATSASEEDNTTTGGTDGERGNETDAARGNETDAARANETDAARANEADAARANETDAARANETDATRANETDATKTDSAGTGNTKPKNAGDPSNVGK